ncbi:protein of unknown function [Paraburkholderia kururiensis]
MRRIDRYAPMLAFDFASWPLECPAQLFDAF